MRLVRPRSLLRQHSLIDVHDDLNAVGARSRPDLLAVVREEQLGDVPQRICTPRIRGDLQTVSFRGNIVAFTERLPQRFDGRLESFPNDRADFPRQRAFNTNSSSMSKKRKRSVARAAAARASPRRAVAST